MSLSKDVNVDLLDRCFELGPFHGLRKPHPDDVTQPVMSQSDVVMDNDEDNAERNDAVCTVPHGLQFFDTVSWAAGTAECCVIDGNLTGTLRHLTQWLQLRSDGCATTI